MELFYLPNLKGDTAILEGDEHHHITRVLRKSIGTPLSFTDGQGRCFKGEIKSLGKHSGEVAILANPISEATPVAITVVTALTKNIKRMEWAFEKLTELGVTHIIPAICKRSERNKFNSARMRKILVSAMKQSERLWLPRLESPTALPDALEQLSGHASRFICHRSPESVMLKTHYTSGQSVVCLIGPEGDFSEAEVDQAQRAGFLSLSLGSKRLRTETASVAFAAAILLNDE